MCTYNGESFLPEQLQSIAAQTRLPDELVICDDRSSDGTAGILNSFSAAVPFAVAVSINEKNMGTTKNFEQAIRLCSGDIIALCDQDDVWLPNKLAEIESIFESRSQTGLVFSDAQVIDKNSAVLAQRLWELANFNAVSQKKSANGGTFEVLMHCNVVTGATIAFRSKFRDLVLPIRSNRLMIHDSWIAALISAVADVVAIEVPLIQYRLHSAQQEGFRRSPHRAATKRTFCDRLEQLENIQQRLVKTGNIYSALRLSQSISHLNMRKAHLRARIELPISRPRRLWSVLCEFATGRYHCYSNGWHSIVADLFLHR